MALPPSSLGRRDNRHHRPSPGPVTIDTTSQEEAHAFIQSHYGRHEPARLEPRGSFHYRSVVRPIGEATITSLTYSGGASTSWESDPAIVGVVRDGNHSLQLGGLQFAQKVGQSFLIPPGVGLGVDWSALDLVALLIPQRLLADVASDFGAEAHVRFHGCTPASPAAADSVLEVMRFAAQTSVHGRLAPEGLLAAQIAKTVTAATLESFGNTASDSGRITAEHAVLPLTVRRAVAYIEGHARQPLSVAQIATACGVSARTLQAAFRRTFSMTPRAYVRRVRLEWAHELLTTADPTAGDTVAAIATRCGFGNLGRFAADYRRAYGELPRETLWG